MTWPATVTLAQNAVAWTAAAAVDVGAETMMVYEFRSRVADFEVQSAVSTAALLLAAQAAVALAWLI